jgi:hypothetical protein
LNRCIISTASYMIPMSQKAHQEVAARERLEWFLVAKISFTKDSERTAQSRWTTDRIPSH